MDVKQNQGREYTWILGLILLAGLGLRLWGIDFDLPYLTHSHEYHEVHRALRLGMGEFDLDRTTKGGLFYLLFVEYSILFVVLIATGVIDSVKDFSFYYLTDPTPFWLIGRATTALLGTATVAVLYFVIRRLVGSTPALVGAAFLAAYPLHVESSHFISVDVPMIFLLMLTLYFCLDLLEYGRRRDYLLAGLFMALAVMTKLPAIPFAASLVLAHILVVHSRGSGLRGLFDRNAIYGGGVFLVTYIAGNPGIVLRFRKTVEKFLPSSSGEALKRDATTAAFSDYQPNLFLYYGDVLAESLGIIVLLLSLGGLILSLKVRRKAGIILGAFTAAYFAAICFSGTRLFYPRYALPLIPFLLIGFAFSYRWIVDHPRLATMLRQRTGWLCLALSVVLIAPLVTQSIKDDIEYSKRHTRILAKEWIEENVAPGTKILLEGNPSSANPKVPLQRRPEDLLAVADEIEEEKPGKAEYLRRLAEIQQGVAYDVTMVWSRFELWESLDRYRDLGIEYIVLNPIKHDRRFDAERKHGDELRESRFALYDQIQEQDWVELVATFDPDDLGAKGHPVQIYRITIP